jgi:hypothetical protein
MPAAAGGGQTERWVGQTGLTKRTNERSVNARGEEKGTAVDMESTNYHDDSNYRGHGEIEHADDQGSPICAHARAHKSDQSTSSQATDDRHIDLLGNIR